MVTISEFSPKIYLIKIDNAITLSELKRLPDVDKTDR